MNVATYARRWSPRILMCLAIVPAMALAAGEEKVLRVDQATLQIARESFGECLTLSGYDGPRQMGGYSPNRLTDGLFVRTLLETAACSAPSPTVVLTVNGFVFDTGSDWLRSITCNEVTLSGASATYTYHGSTGTASWSFPTGFGLSSIGAGTQLFLPYVGNVSCTIVHERAPWGF